jgi:hypothetical protein
LRKVLPKSSSYPLPLGKIQHARPNQDSRLLDLDLQDPPNQASRHPETENLGRAVDAQARLDGKVSPAEDASRADEIVQGSTDTRDKEKFWYCYNNCDYPGPWRNSLARCITCEHDRCRNCLKSGSASETMQHLSQARTKK